MKHSRLEYKIPMASPDFSGNEEGYLVDALKSGSISGSGKYIDKLEKSLKDYFKQEVALVTNGTTALHLLLHAHGIKNGDEIITSSMTFVATANAAIYCGAKPRFADVELNSWNIDINSIEKLVNEKTKAIIVTHLFGQPVELDPILKLAEKHKILIFEDAAEAIGAEYGGKKIGTLADGAVFSMYGNKTITSGEGGFIVSQNPEIIRKIKLLRSQGEQPERFNHIELGFNYRITNIQAAIGLAQFEKIEKFLYKRSQIFRIYNSFFNETKILVQEKLPLNSKHGFWQLGITVENLEIRNIIVQKLEENKIETRPFFKPLNTLEYMNNDDECPNAQYLWERGICLPTHTQLDEQTISSICKLIKIGS